ncbi:MAG: hypothetical protein CVV27_03250 [Candidatus Melainabacteria bacterium HGW-Melainabacteria-1]|nr:MAG: hypothetical protein CVV27_03250 [Candidatus Melainabacteria bacterium HGW-Melainabacteria-1]
MVVPVVLGQSTFDYAPMRAEQARLAKTLVIPSPRDKDDTSATMEIEDDQATPFKYPTFIKVLYGKEGTLPTFQLWMKDNFDQEFKVSKERRIDANGNYIDVVPGLATTQGINDDPLVAPANNFQSFVNNNFAINPVTGDIFRNAYWDEGLRQVIDANGNAESNPLFIGQRLGTIKFDGITGLGLAAINSRIADISNAVEAVTKVLSVTSGNMDAVINLIR